MTEQLLPQQQLSVNEKLPAAGQEKDEAAAVIGQTASGKLDYRIIYK